MMQTVTVSRTVVAIVFLILASLAVADEAIEEIVVKADFRERPASELPASISLLESEFIEAAAVQHFEELVNVVPNLNWSGDGHRARYFQIRGVGELERAHLPAGHEVGLVGGIEPLGVVGESSHAR